MKLALTSSRTISAESRWRSISSCHAVPASISRSCQSVIRPAPRRTERVHTAALVRPAGIVLGEILVEHPVRRCRGNHRTPIRQHFPRSTDPLPSIRRSLHTLRCLSFFQLREGETHRSKLIFLGVVTQVPGNRNGSLDVTVNEISMTPFTTAISNPAYSNSTMRSFTFGGMLGYFFCCRLATAGTVGSLEEPGMGRQARSERRSSRRAAV